MNDDLNFVVNTLADNFRQRIAAAISGGYDAADTLHNVYLDYGYPLQLDFFNFWNMYRRFGVATRVVELYPDQTWLDDPIIESDNTAFLSELETLVDRFGLWRRLKGLDIRQRVGRYAGLFMRVRDGLQPNQPIEGMLPGVNALFDMIPLYESQLKVLTTESDPTSEQFGFPTSYQFASNTGRRNENVAASFTIDPDRVVVVAEGSDNSNIYGIPALENVYNSLMDLRKVLGGGAEGFYKNAAQSVVLELLDLAGAKNNKDLLKDLGEQYDEFARNRMRRAFMAPGLSTKTLESNLVDPQGFKDALLDDIAAGSGTPRTLLVGNQTGRLAGDQDTKGFLAQVQARRTSFGVDMVRTVVDWFISFGVLPFAEYTVEWPDALALSHSERIANAGGMATINQKQFQSGLEAVFTSDEIRAEAGFELEPEEPVESEGERIEDE